RTLSIVSFFSLLLLVSCTDDTNGDDTGAGSSSSDASPSTGNVGDASSSGSDDAITTTEGSSSGVADGSSSGSDPSAGESSDGSGSESTGGGDPNVLSNTPSACFMQQVVGPILPDEASHLAAATLTPTAYPYEVTSVGYVVIGAPTDSLCNSTLAHRVDVYVIEGSEPPADPTADAVSELSISVDADAAATDYRTVLLDLETPIVLEDGQSLVVAVELAPDDEVATSICIESCLDTGGVAGLDWWSNADEAPYAWADMVAVFGYSSNFTTYATGHVQ
ncbi:MAG: hypothetical protein IAG13_05580, partial [Deltaproteobacteria bacterium]|nr:hypothetical protein [Nannocystaceae bacterium]